MVEGIRAEDIIPLGWEIFHAQADLDANGELLYEELSKVSEWGRMWMRITAAASYMGETGEQKRQALLLLLQKNRELMHAIDNSQRLNDLGIASPIKVRSSNVHFESTLNDLNDVYVSTPQGIRNYLKEKISEKLKNFTSLESIDSENIMAVELWATAVQLTSIWSSIEYCDGQEGLSFNEIEDLGIFGHSMSSRKIDPTDGRSEAVDFIIGRFSIPEPVREKILNAIIILDSSYTGRLLLGKLVEKIRYNNFRITLNNSTNQGQFSFGTMPMKFSAGSNSIVINSSAIIDNPEFTMDGLIAGLAHEIFHVIMYTGEAPSRIQPTIAGEVMAERLAQLVNYELGLEVDRRNSARLMDTESAYSHALNSWGIFYYSPHERTTEEFQRRESSFSSPFWSRYIEERLAYLFEIGPSYCHF